MKKLLSILLLLPVLLSAQRIDSTLSEERFGNITGKFYKTTEAGVTNYYLVCSFKNAKYEYISDFAMIFITNQEATDSLAADLESAIKYFETKTTARYDRREYKIVHYDFAPGMMYIMDRDDKYTTMNKGHAEKWLAWLKTIKFP
ncbi:MAG TPA: hypothetical protein VK826_10175 [Bacteroidia bacterium]|nr:hypothetical protein [Bacteroidia bacterium]